MFKQFKRHSLKTPGSWFIRVYCHQFSVSLVFDMVLGLYLSIFSLFSLLHPGLAGAGWGSCCLTKVVQGNDDLAGTYSLFTGAASFLPSCMWVYLYTLFILSYISLFAVTSAPTLVTGTLIRVSCSASGPRAPPTWPPAPSIRPPWPPGWRAAGAPGPAPTPRTTCPGASTRSPSPCPPALGPQLSLSSWSSMLTRQLWVNLSNLHDLNNNDCREVVTATVSTRRCVRAPAALCTTSPPPSRCRCSTWRRQTSPARMTDQTSSLLKSMERNNVRPESRNF